jgi:uncharacterized membrane protein
MLRIIRRRLIPAGPSPESGDAPSPAGRGRWVGRGPGDRLHAEGSIALYGRAVVAKDADGKVAVREAADQGPLGTAVGLVTGGLVGLVGGAVGVAVGAAAGTIGGATYDVATAVVGEDFLSEAARSLEPGTWAVVAEVEEEWVTRVDARMEALGGAILSLLWFVTPGPFLRADVWGRAPAPD